ncbi:MAG: DEAD/DEAH box helicase [Verrucomicrobia bacterium]|nr:DEAD/DEAH box helicase [Verrucomicrobiota bacterium]
MSLTQLKSLRERIEYFDSRSKKRGAEYLAGGQVRKIALRPDGVTALVQGTELYKVQWQETEGVWESECTCPVTWDCKHAFAVALHILQQQPAAKQKREDAMRTGLMDARIDHLLAYIDRVPGRAVERAPAKRSLVSQILDVRNSWEAFQPLRALLFELGIRIDALGAKWFTFLDSNNREKRAWLFAQELLKHGTRLPPELEHYRHHKTFELEAQRKRENAFADSIREWMSHPPSLPVPPTRSIRVVWSWDGQPSKAKGPRIALLLSSKRLKDEPRSLQQARNLAAEAIRDVYRFSPDDVHFLRWLESRLHGLAQHSDSIAEDDRIPSPSGHALLAWLSAWGRSNRCVWEDGSTVRLDDAPAHIVPEIQSADVGTAAVSSDQTQEEEEAMPRLGFAVEIPNLGRFPVRETRIVLPAEGSARVEPVFVFVNGCFYRLVEGPPITVLRASLQAGPLPLTSERCAVFLPQLARRFPELHKTSEGLVRRHPVNSRFLLSLDSNDWLCVRLGAASLETKHQWEFTGEGWTAPDTETVLFGGKTVTAHATSDLEHLRFSEETPASHSLPPPVEDAVAACAAPFEPPTPAVKQREACIHVPDSEQTRPCQEWLEGLGVQGAKQAGFEHKPGWWTHLSGKRIEILLGQWPHRPSAAEYWGNPAFRRLLAPSKHFLPRVKVRASGVDWFSVSAEWASLADQLTPEDVGKLRSSKEAFIKLASGQWVAREQAAGLDAALETLADLGLDPLSANPQRLTVWQLAGSGEAALKKLAILLDKDGDSETLAALREMKIRLSAFQGVPDIPIPQRVRAQLRGYQTEGIKFLAYVSSLQLGPILADDMGLGKTLQALAWMEHLRDTEGPAPCLVVCPASVVHNWQREAEKFVPGASVLLLTSGEARHGLRKEIPRHDLIVTNYALLRRDLEELRRFEFRAAVLDEAQNIKNPDSQVARAAKQLNAKHRMALTGTPLENRLLDLWSIADFTTPGYLGARGRFTQTYDVPDQPHRRRLLSARLRPILLRRLKGEVAPDLPDRIEERQDCELTEGQRLLYLAELKQARQMVNDFGEHAALAERKIHVLAALTRLRQVCCHPALVGGKTELGSGKTLALLELLDPLIAEGHKVLVFSQFVQMLKILQTEFESRNIPYHLLTGQTTRREAVVDAFQQDARPCVFLLSLRAAGTGLNLTAASYVVLYDPWWNPAVEAQAIDRTHRIGQDRTVITYRLVARETVEDKIFQLQEQKAAMVKDVLGEEGFAKNLTREDLQYLFSE